MPASRLLSSVACAGKVKWGQQSKRVTKTRVGEVVANVAALGRRGNEPTFAEARQVVRQVGPRRGAFVSKRGRVRGSVEQPAEDPATGRVGEGGTDAPKCVEVDGRYYSDS